MVDAEMRLHRYIAQCGVTSRRKAEELIEDGRVAVNGQIITTQGVKVSSGDVVEVDGERIGIAQAVTVLLNKPKGYITTLHDEKRRPTVMQLIPSVGPVKPVGRLDMDSEGLLLLTSDGEFAARLTHARYGIEKEYRVVVIGVPDERDLQRMRNGLFIEGRKTDPCDVAMIQASGNGGQSTLSVVLREGRNRQVRRMFEAIGHDVVKLTRIRIAHLTLKGMRPGECIRLGQKDVDRLRLAVGLGPTTGR